ncbi:hypothetical protein CEPID_10385 [Corynebacterium epidermidicanis]|uniref:Uncharacterized protein n=1 Tax=Corynebacterium epidermidicanis TaxID=1050174 RepID=A0A0G3GYH4_9CORY|nr:hypothetical protein CEPID_10385 [Corynebacterium epidermidicanis]
MALKLLPDGCFRFDVRESGFPFGPSRITHDCLSRYISTNATTSRHHNGTPR